MLPRACTCFLLCHFSHWLLVIVHVMQTHNKTLSKTVSVCQLTWQEQRAIFHPIFTLSNCIHPEAHSLPWLLNSTRAGIHWLKSVFLFGLFSPCKLSHLSTPRYFHPAFGTGLYLCIVLSWRGCRGNTVISWSWYPFILIITNDRGKALSYKLPTPASLPQENSTKEPGMCADNGCDARLAAGTSCWFITNLSTVYSD